MPSGTYLESSTKIFPKLRTTAISSLTSNLELIATWSLPFVMILKEKGNFSWKKVTEKAKA